MKDTAVDLRSGTIAVFFYGLFMDASLLATKGIQPSSSEIGFVEGYALRIGRRATLVRAEASRAYGVLMTIRSGEAKALYAEPSVTDYLAEPVSVTTADGARVAAVCFNLPPDQLGGTNSAYATALLALAEQLGLPGDYLEAIREQAAPEVGRSRSPRDGD